MGHVLNASFLCNHVLNKSIRSINRNSCKSYSTQSAIKVKEDKEKANDELMKDYERLSNISIRVRPKMPQKPPFVNNLFLGVYDTDILTYPQLQKEDVENLDKQIEPIQKYFDELPLLQKPPTLSSDFMENLRKLNLFGLQGSQLLGARELNITESCRVYDITGSNTSTASTLIHNDQFGIQAITKKGTETQKQKYLPQLLTGQTLSAFCITENSMADLTSLKTTAVLTGDQKTWILNGEKLFTINGGNADLLLVVAATEFLNKLGLKEKKLTTFIVEKAFGGVTCNPCKTLGIKGTDVSNITFNNTPVPVDNVLGKVNEGESVLTDLLTEFRLSTGPACTALLKKLMDNLVKHCTDTTNISETDCVRSTVAEIATKLYAMESITYLTTGLLDHYENQDCQTESAIVKAFSSEETCNSVLKCMELIGAPTYVEDHWCNILYRDALSHLIFYETNESLKLAIALLGLRHAGLNLQDSIKKVRNPLFYPAEMFRRIWRLRKQNVDNPALTLGLQNYVHPSCVNASQWLEYCVLRLQYATEKLLIRYGPEVVNKHMELKRVAECAMDIYAMTACLGRASRSYCIGLQHADYEMLLANTFCLDAMLRVRERVRKIADGPYATNDEHSRKICKRVFKFGKYFPVHPLTRNF